MSSGCGDVLSLADLQTAKKHQIFEAEVITGKQGGVAGGADIDYATNQVTGQTQKTLPAVLRDAGFRPASFTFASGGTLNVNDADLAVLWPSPTGDGMYYSWHGALPKIIPAGSSPETTGGVSDAAWKLVGDTGLRGDLAGPNGYTLIPSVQIQNWKDIGDIRGWGAVEGQDCTSALQAAINDRAALGYGTSSDVIINGNYQINGKVFLTTDVRLIGNWASITSTSNDWIFESGYKNGSGDVVSNHGLADDVAIGTARLKGTVVSGITFVGVSKVFHLNCFTERCGLEDLAFENCGIAWDARLSFYPFYKNIIIRGAKTGFESQYAYQLRHQCNQTYLEKVSISGRAFGELVADDIIPNPIATVNCQNIHKKQCSYEQVTTGVKVDMTTYGYQDENWYAENVTGNLYIFGAGDHFDTLISAPSWLYGVEAQGTFNNMKGRSTIYQGTQYNYNPAKRSAMQFNTSIARVIPAVDLGGYGTTSTQDYGIAYDATSIILLDGVAYTADKVPVNVNQTNTVAVPVNTSGYVPTVFGKGIGVTGATYAPGADQLNMSTDIFWSVNNCILVSLRVFQTSVPSNSFNATAILMNGQKVQLAGQPVSYSQDGNLTRVTISNPAAGGSTAWLTSGDFTIEGSVRFM